MISEVTQIVPSSWLASFLRPVDLRNAIQTYFEL